MTLGILPLPRQFSLFNYNQDLSYVLFGAPHPTLRPLSEDPVLGGGCAGVVGGLLG